ncbi:MAG: translocation/assembly module TamB domain-containing protein, partial [Cyclobacteriaceae bacterium]|nr:translocation/assembly module TamB domain-containing protein [Cyclobacteriaceae bacterium]
NQLVDIEGSISRNTEDQLMVKMAQVDIRNINGFINKELSGLVDGTFNISGWYENFKIENELFIDELRINDFLVGDIYGQNVWNKDTKLFDLNLTIGNDSIHTMSLKGTFNPAEKGSVAMDAELNYMNIDILEPFIEGYFSELEGYATGDFKISGPLFALNIDGTGFIEEGHMIINYLRTHYDFDGDFTFSEDEIFISKIEIIDEANNHGELSGRIYHGGFQTMEVDLQGEFERLMILNTTPKDNDLFYGQGYATGNVSFTGPTSNLSISATAKSEKGTKIFIPIGGLESVQKEDFISFVNFSDTTASRNKKESIEKLDLNGVKLDLNLDITPDAYCEIIFDIKAGDIIRGRGNGDLKLVIDTNGEFSMFGPLTIQEGWYNFTLYNIINKEFTIVPGGKITWYGDPYEGVMNLSASYDQLASFAPILNQDWVDSPDLKRKYITRVMMGLSGPLLNPEIDFNISSENLPRNISVTGTGGTTSVDLNFEFDSFIKKIDEQELKRQVFSLIVLRKFSPPESFNTGGALSNSVSELFSNQLSYWISQVDENLEIDFDVDLTSFDREAFNTFQLRLSYTFLDGRLRVTRDGSFVNHQNQVNVNSLAGDWLVEYLLRDDGKLRVRMYNKANYNNITSNIDIENRGANTTGFSLQYTQSFEEFFKEMTRIFKKKEEKKENEKPSANNQAIRNKEDEIENS